MPTNTSDSNTYFSPLWFAPQPRTCKQRLIYGGNRCRMSVQVHSIAHPVGPVAFVHPAGTTHQVPVAAQSKLVVGGVVVHAQG